ncbi:hypothetical protein OWV82_009137 [Melia azedarach]|uniref:Uncharacterized protein n=1 Tax=Melia azedarach TaxID=155640 RepID=A0ACC1YEL0_MELAZ|nr:hypothetical protein OWV82_009137 [Melia azedarach]
MFLPEQFSGVCYAVFGLVFISIPWIFWILVYIYNCFAPPDYGNQIYSGSSRHLPSALTSQGNSPKAKASTTMMTTTTTETTVSSDESPVPYVNSGRHVQFGEVTILGSEEDGKIDDVENAQNSSHQPIREAHLKMINESPGEFDSNTSSNSSRDWVGHSQIEKPLTGR